MKTITNAGSAPIVLAAVAAIHENAAYLSEVDGATGDGDHGVNMNKGFMLAAERISEDDSLSDALKTLGRTLVMDIGGSMGPIYGTMFRSLARALRVDEIGAVEISAGLNDAVTGLKDLAGAQEGDKTLIDTIAPATRAFDAAVAEGEDLTLCLDALKRGAEEGLESTKDMVAKIGRASRLGERSRGFLDAGATSCCIILTALATGMQERAHS